MLQRYQERGLVCVTKFMNRLECVENVRNFADEQTDFTLMEQTIVKSFRWKESTFDLLEKQAKRLRWWKRNAVAESILRFALQKLSDDDIYDIVRTNEYNADKWSKWTLELEKNEDIK